MKPWDIYTFDFPNAGKHPAVVIGLEEKVANRQIVNLLLCSSQRANRPPLIHEVLLNGADGLDWETLCKCDLIYYADKSELTRKRGTVTRERRRQIAERIIIGLGLAGL